VRSILLPLREKVARQGRMRGLSTAEGGGELSVAHPLIRPASPSTFSRKGRRIILALARLTGRIAGVASGLLLFLGQLLALLAGGALGGFDFFLSALFGGQTSRFLLGLLTALFGLLQLELLTLGLLLGGALQGQLLELGILDRRLGLELGQQSLLGLLLRRDAVVEAGLFKVSHA